jgi:ankyrin
VDAQAIDDLTPLHVALCFGGAKVTQLLLEHGANPNLRNVIGQTPLHGALTKITDYFKDNYFDAVRLILECGADVEALDDDHSTPLHVASRYGSVKAVRLLLEHRAYIEALDNRGSAPLHIASERGHGKAACQLLEHGANIHALNKEDQTPLKLLLGSLWGSGFSHHHINLIRLFLRHGENVDSVDENSSTMLHAALYWGSLELIQLLLEHGANINAQDKNGQTPLHRTLIDIPDDGRDQFFDPIRYFLDHGADVDALDNDQSTPLHVASQYGSVKATRILLEHGASPHLKNHEGKTALQVASMAGHEEIMQLLSEQVQNEYKVGWLPIFSNIPQKCLPA